MGDGFQDVSRLLSQAIEVECFPGAVLVVGYQGALIYEQAVGTAALIPRLRPMTLDTVFDLASLTKPLATVTAIMLLVETGLIRLDAPMKTYLHACGRPDRPSPTLRQLLSHCSGLPAWRPYYQTIDPSLPVLARRCAVYAAAHREPLSHPPGSTVEYSDLGFILLGELVEAVSGIPLDEFCQREIFARLLLGEIGFRRLEQPLPAGVSYANTERCSWRRRILEGEVHDENAWIMGGVAGHAGLFATARQVWQFAQGLMEGLQGQRWLVSTSTLRTFTTRQDMPEGSTWALGWDTPTPGRSSAGQYISSTAIGHLGFTGTSLWIDASQQVIVALFTNRVHPSRQREGIKTFRPLIHDAVMRALGLASGARDLHGFSNR
jgi:CubicO group peptidase (beta-lactamase class C family)